MKLRELDTRSILTSEDSVTTIQGRRLDNYFYIGLSGINLKLRQTIKKLNYFNRVILEKKFFQREEVEEFQLHNLRGTFTTKDFLTNFYRKIGDEILVNGELQAVKVHKMIRFHPFDDYHCARVIFHPDANKQDVIEAARRKMLSELNHFYEEINSIIRGEIPVLECKIDVENQISSRAVVFVDRVEYQHQIINPQLQFFEANFRRNVEEFCTFDEKDSIRSLSKKFNELTSDGYFSSAGRRTYLIKKRI